MSLRLAAAFPALSVAAALTVAPFAFSPAASAACPDAEVVFARGTGEPAGVGTLGNAFVSALRSRVPDKSVSAYGVNYPANYNFLAATSGAGDAGSHIQKTVNACPATKLVLGGYSQGAAVIDILTASPVPALGFRQPLPADVADHVAAVVVFGNPSARLGNPLTTLSGQYGPKTIDLCDGGDPVCEDGRNWAAHAQYVQTGMVNQAADFAAARL